MPEFVWFDGCIARDGCKPGEGTIYCCWDERSTCHEKTIANSLKQQRWFQLKRIFKLCNNNMATKRGEEGYNPCYKYDLIYDVIT